MSKFFFRNNWNYFIDNSADGRVGKLHVPQKRTRSTNLSAARQRYIYKPNYTVELKSFAINDNFAFELHENTIVSSNLN